VHHVVRPLTGHREHLMDKIPLNLDKLDVETTTVDVVAPNKNEIAVPVMSRDCVEAVQDDVHP
jgi:hypothetical protein